jgi:lysozyme
MKTSPLGLIEIVSHEGICLEWYYDSVGVPTIGIGQTAHDGFDPRTAGPLTLQGAFDLFKQKLVPYENAVNNLGRELNQTQFDALVSFCYNVGPGNLRKLCRLDRSLADIGQAIMLYKIPPEIVPRRTKERDLFRSGRYSNTTGRVLVFPVSVTHKPLYVKGYSVDARPYLGLAPSGPSGPAEPAEPGPPPLPPAPEPVETPKDTRPESMFDWLMRFLR